MSAGIFVVTSTGQGHLFPCIELCNHLASRNYQATLVLPSQLSSSLPPSFLQNPLLRPAPITAPARLMVPESDPLRQQSAAELEAYLSSTSDSVRILCAVVDFQMSWTKGIFWKFNIPVIGFFTFGACAAAMEWGAWKVDAGNIRPGESRTIPGLPEEMCVEYSDLKRRPGGPPRGIGGPPGPRPGGRGPPKPGDMPPWVPAIEGSIGLMFNTCDDLERPFLEYMGNQMGMPVWGVGPLLPEQYWKSLNSLIRDGQIRASKHESNFTEDHVIQWLESRQERSVLYVSFGSEVTPTTEEFHELARALEDSNPPFIWAIKNSSELAFLDELEKRVGKRGLIIRGWAPQLLILSHKSTGGFISHCGWNSTAEAVGLGVPILAWPIRGDQHYNAKLVVKQLKVGAMAVASERAGKEDIVKGIERVMGDEELRKRAGMLRRRFESGFPGSCEAAFEAVGKFISQRAT
ncbi:hypothetical protein VitviT2T_002693 [Vitis vinifera]|uniref:Glycosyltransferase n=3 Tax=Vitis vinifera TaxID=29760 RepID=A0ABY9BJI3_VITVI|nr:UDP-glycosyltransferase 73C4 [Vitis vinifera]WJZ82975.1 hypothetical protein VitviT2T_002693 [Vitis vinifera]|eukprot:XP_002263935.2 PREDICTED: scopoletin glucosyltransferase-like [Vitis vinifera]